MRMPPRFALWRYRHISPCLNDRGIDSIILSKVDQPVILLQG
jgi:hypothetical protein